MNIEDLKELIKDLPDKMPVVECRAGNVGRWTYPPNLSIRKVYKFNTIKNYGINKGSPYEVEFCEVYKGSEILSEYDALVFYTTE